MKVKGLKFVKEMNAREWFERRYAKLIRKFMRKIEKLVDKANSKGIDFNYDYAGSLCGIVNTEVGDYCNISVDSETKIITGVINPDIN